MIPLRIEIKAALLVGLLDITAACTQYALRTGNTPLYVVKFVASGVFGQRALTGGTEMIIVGLVFHFFNAFLFTWAFFWIVPKVPFLRRNVIRTGVLYGVFVWAVMNLVVLPLSNTPALHLDVSRTIQAMLILICCIGLPLSFILYKTWPPSKQNAVAPDLQ